MACVSNRGAGTVPPGVPVITTVSSDDLTGETALASLTDGILKHASGIPATATAGTDYVKPTGVSGGQTVQGDTASSGNLTLDSTANATKGKVILGSASAYDQANDRLGIGTTSPTLDLQVIKASAAAGSVAGQVKNSTGTGTASLSVSATTLSTAQLVAYGATYSQAGVTDIPNSGELRNLSGGGLSLTARNGALKVFNGTGGSETLSFTVDNNGNVAIGNAAVATNATNGFIFVGSCAGTPTGVPAGSYTGRIPVVYDSTNNLLYAYANSAWRIVGTGAAPAAHTHAESDVTSLVSDLAGKAASSHTHTESDLSLSDVTTANATTTAHGLLLKATAPAATIVNFVGIGNGETSYTNKALFDSTTPAALGSAGTGSATVAARRDHVHALPTLDGLNAPTDVTTLNASTSAHGLVVKATAPAANVLNVVGIANGETAYTNKSIFDSTNPAALGTAAPGTSLVAAHRDHVHALPALDTLNATTDITTLNASTSAHGLLPKLDNTATHYLDGTGAWSTPAGSASNGISNLSQVGTSPLNIQVIGGQMVAANLTAQAIPNANKLMAFPLLNMGGRTIDTMSIRISGSTASANCRIGLYSATSSTNLYPNTLLEDSGNLSLASTGQKVFTLGSPRALTAGTLYWVAFLSESTTPSITCMPLSSMYPIFGTDSTISSNSSPGVGLQVAQAFGALPNPFTASAAVYNDGFYSYGMAICVHFSA